jgi:hypothetical protein
MQRYRGLRALITDAVEHGSRAVERVQIRIAKQTFDVLEAIEPIAVPVKGIHEIHDAAVAGVHGMIRLVNRVVGDTAEVVLDEVEKRQAKEGGPAGEPPA